MKITSLENRSITTAHSKRTRCFQLRSTSSVLTTDWIQVPAQYSRKWSIIIALAQYHSKSFQLRSTSSVFQRTQQLNPSRSQSPANEDHQLSIPENCKWSIIKSLPTSTARDHPMFPAEEHQVVHHNATAETSSECGVVVE
jgi:hypothetical protein